MLSDLGTSYGSPLGPTFCSNLSKWINLVNCDHHNRKIRYSCASEVGIIHLFLQIFKQPFVFIRHWTSSINTCFYILPVAIFVIVFNIPRFLELKTCFNDNMPDVCPTELRMQVSYSRH